LDLRVVAGKRVPQDILDLQVLGVVLGRLELKALKESEVLEVPKVRREIQGIQGIQGTREVQVILEIQV
jgi:hypothetical protein